MSLICVTDLAFLLVGIPHLISLLARHLDHGSLARCPRRLCPLATRTRRRPRPVQTPRKPVVRALDTLQSPDTRRRRVQPLPGRPGSNMTMTLDTSQQQRFGPPLSFEYAAHAQPPAFSNPWSSSPSPTQSTPTAGNALFVHGQQQPGLGHHSLVAAKPPLGRGSASGASMASYGSMPLSATSSGTAAHVPCAWTRRLTRDAAEMMSLNRMQATSAAFADASYTTSASPVSGHFAPTSAPPYEAMGYAPAPSRHASFGMPPEADSARRFSHHQ